ncbi:plastocyanin/azurin family copper-binding protein [Natrarchaeobius sp. A-rgal3]|uniref:plastocyanin/azurin family copper-binding protein n=1 Tax=Natrarchaeobius versutus TaxID=1679078 RepID=UPI003510C3E7
MHHGSRRTFLKVAGATAATAVVAGCSSDGNGNGNGDDSGNGNGDGEVAIDAGTDIRFDGQTAGWEGLEPSEIDGEQNPTLVLEEGGDYTIGWTEGDGSLHNIEIWDDGGEVVDGLETSETDDPGDDQILEFEASSDMAQYVCDPHETTMVGDIQVE